MEELIEAIKKRLTESSGLMAIVDPEGIRARDDDCYPNHYPRIVLEILDDAVGGEEDPECRVGFLSLCVLSKYSTQQVIAMCHFIQVCLNDTRIELDGSAVVLQRIYRAAASDIRYSRHSGEWHCGLDYLTVCSAVSKEEAIDPTEDAPTLQTDELPPDPAEDELGLHGDLLKRKRELVSIVLKELDLPELAELVVEIETVDRVGVLRKHLEASVLCHHNDMITAGLKEIGYDVRNYRDKIEEAKSSLRKRIELGWDIVVEDIALEQCLSKPIIKCACEELVTTLPDKSGSFSGNA